MWHHFITLPFVAWVIGLLGVGALAAYGWLKRKAIATAVGVLRHAAGQRFWDYLRRQLQADEKPGAPATKARLFTRKTYRGIFHGYNQYANYPKSISSHSFTARRCGFLLCKRTYFQACSTGNLLR